MSRLTIDVTDHQHQSLKALAALQGKTIKQYAIEKLFSPASEEERALLTLKTLLHQRIAEADNGEVDTRDFSEIAKAELKAGTPRG
jgi:Antitoxin ParD